MSLITIMTEKVEYLKLFRLNVTLNINRAR